MKYRSILIFLSVYRVSPCLKARAFILQSIFTPLIRWVGLSDFHSNETIILITNCDFL
jgi:hypothetical protein